MENSSEEEKKSTENTSTPLLSNEEDRLSGLNQEQLGPKNDDALKILEP